MRNEYLRCLVRKYAPASGPAAVRDVSEVSSMYLEGRLPGWFSLLFASARLVAHVEKQVFKASMGLAEVRFDHMHAYNSDMEAARREARADIELPELDGHHVIPVITVPLGSPGHVHAYIDGKAGELLEELESVLGRGIFNAISSARQYNHFLNDPRGSASYVAAVREAWGRLKAAAVGHLSDANPA
eukprot:jgi/Tetstr1/457009/TSEL_043673.t1